MPNTEHGTGTFYTWEDILYLNILPGLLSCSPFCRADVPRSTKRYFTAVFCSFFLSCVSLILNDNLVSYHASRPSLDILYCIMTLSPRGWNMVGFTTQWPSFIFQTEREPDPLFPMESFCLACYPNTQPTWQPAGILDPCWRWQTREQRPSGAGHLTHTINTNLHNSFGFKEIKAHFSKTQLTCWDFIWPIDKSKLVFHITRSIHKIKSSILSLHSLQINFSALFHK